MTTFAGAIVNSGRLVAETGIHYDFFKVFGAGTSGGGITNTGTITAADRGINLDLGTTFTGVVANTSVIAAHGTGIKISDVTTFSGGVSNSGKITATSGAGIEISSGTVFGSISAGGSVVNSGTISAAQGIVVQAATIAGAIINNGGIVAKGDVFGKSDGIFVLGVSTFLGGVSNRGSISAGHIGIEFGKSTTNAFGVSSVVGSIVNSGTITAKTGIALFQSTITGAIVDSGSIKATSHGILINSGSEILAGKTAINIAGPTFTGGISNFGVVSGSAGIEIKSAHAVSIFDAGRNRRHRAAPRSSSPAAATRSRSAPATRSAASSILPARTRCQLGGTGSGTFDLSSIGSAAQYRGFTTFNVVGGTWTVTSASTAHWTIKSGGTLEVASGGELTSTTVSSGGVLVIESGGTASSSFVKAGGTEIIESGAVVSGAIISSGATVELVGGIALPLRRHDPGWRHPGGRAAVSSAVSPSAAATHSKYFPAAPI